MARSPRSPESAPRAAVLVLVAFTTAIALSGSGAPVSAAEPSPAPVAPLPSAIGPLPSAVVEEVDLDAAGFPPTVLGLPVLSVADARALIDAGGVAGRAMAVGGWWSQGIMSISCPVPDHALSVVEGYCRRTALAASDVQVVRYSSTGRSPSESFLPPTGSLEPRLVPESAGGDPWDGVTDVARRQLPRRVVVVGHVGDPRAWACVPTVRGACDAAFVVDRFAWIEGRETGPEASGGAVAASADRAEAMARITAALPGDATVLTLGRWRGAAAADLDPRAGWLRMRRLWFARAVVGLPDAAGTAPLVQAIMSDAGGDVTVLEVAPAATAIPATVHVETGYVPGRARVSVIRSDGTVMEQQPLQARWTPPMVLPAGDYRVRVRVPAGADAGSAGVDVTASCVLDRVLAPAESLTVTVTFQGPRCELAVGSG